MSTSFEQLNTHASRFGSEAVMETAISAGLTEPQLVELQTTCDEADQRIHGRRYRKPRLSAAVRVRRLLERGA